MRVCLANWWTTLVGFIGGAALYLVQAGITFPETKQDWYAFVLALVVGGLGLLAKDATTGSAPTKKTGGLPLPAIVLAGALALGASACAPTARWDDPTLLTTEQRIEYEAGAGLLTLVRAVNTVTDRVDGLVIEGLLTADEYADFVTTRLRFRAWWQPVYAAYQAGRDVSGAAGAFYDWQATLVDTYLRLKRAADGRRPT